jgi:hypothetical protein
MANDWMCKHFRLNLLDDASGRTFADAATKCFGLGPAKATYAAGMLAFDDAGCIDRWMARQYGLPEKFATMKAYREAYATIGWGHTLDQWSDFLSVEDFRRDQHDVFFRSVLGSAAVTA